MEQRKCKCTENVERIDEVEEGKNLGSETLDMTSEMLGEKFEGDFEEMWTKQIPLVSMMGTRGPAKHAKMGSKDPYLFFLLL